jgi:glycolate oxidase iron-sulfur subunit
MQTQLSTSLLSTERGREADAILRRCVHCGFCNATCPTYQIIGDELDGPRGRIYLIKQMLEGDVEGGITRLHLDRCLTCRSCETTCPSGVQYERLLGIGREYLEQHTERPLQDQILRWGLSNFLSRPARFRVLLRLTNLMRSLLPGFIRNALPLQTSTSASSGSGLLDKGWPTECHARRMILMRGCVQDVVAQNINQATAQVLDQLSISAIRVEGEGCCGALDQHLTELEKARNFMRRNIDSWWSYIEQEEQGIEAIISTSSACGLQVKDYGYLLKDDPDYANKAARVSALVKDISEVLGQEVARPVESNIRKVAFHAPCTLTHGQKLDGLVEGILQRWGYETVPVADSHLCCGSAGTYSILNPELAEILRTNKLTALQTHQPDMIASANIGCLLHLQKSATVPVKHWVELLVDSGTQ